MRWSGSTAAGQLRWRTGPMTLNADSKLKCGAVAEVEAVVAVVRRHRDGPAVLLEEACAAMHITSATG